MLLPIQSPLPDVRVSEVDEGDDAQEKSAAEARKRANKVRRAPAARAISAFHRSRKAF